MQTPPKHLSFASLHAFQSKLFKKIADSREQHKVCHTYHDTLMSGFAMMMLQEPSMLQFMQRAEQPAERTNLHTLFGVKTLPSDSQMREIIDDIAPEQIMPMFDEILKRAQRAKLLEQYEFLDGYYLAAVDGSQYFSSQEVNCLGCLIKNHSSGEIWFSHHIVQMAILKKGIPHVLPLAPEEVRNSDGTEKQDCEVNAAKRLLARIRELHPLLQLVITGDSIYAHKPMIELLKFLKRYHYIFVVKPGDHKTLFKDIEGLRKEGLLSTHETREANGELHRYRWVNEIALVAGADSPLVNYFEYEHFNKRGKLTYSCTWITDFPITKENVPKLVEGGRARWKIENETFNTLKNQGYHIEHNFGHGKKHLSFNFFLLNLLAFTYHQLFELADKTYQVLRKKFGSKRNLWDHIRVALYFFIFNDWQALLDKVFYGGNLPSPSLSG